MFRGGRPLASSGVLASTADDLCDASIVDDSTSPMRPFLSGCRVSDPQLVNFQQMLVDKVEIALDANGAALKGPRELVFRYRPSQTSAGALLDAAREAGLVILDLSTEESDLEDIFIELTRQPAAA